MRKHTALVLSSIVAICAHAQSGAESIDSLNKTLDEVVVTALTAPKTAVSTAPLRIVDQHQMLRSGVSDVSDALHRMPGVNLRDYGGAGGLKTVSVRGFGASHTGVFYDGVPLSDVQSGQIDLSRYSVDNVRSVGIVIGDNDDIFIPARLAASAATVSISSLPVVDRPDLSLKLRMGSFGLYNPFIRVGVPINENAAINFVGEYTHADNDYPFTLKNGTLITKEKRTNSRMNSGHGEINLLYNLSSTTSLKAKIYYYNNSRNLPGPVIYYNNVSHEHLEEQNAIAQAQLQSSITSRLSLSGLLKYNFASSKYHDENGKYPGGILNQNYWQREYYSSLSALYTIADKWIADYSIDYFYNNLNSNLTNDGRPYRNSILQTVTAKYKSRRFTMMLRILESLYFNGVKVGTSAKNASKLSPSMSISYQPLTSQLLYLRASYKNIFRMPTFNEAYFDHYGSKDILPESTDQINLGATYTLRGNGWLPQATFTADCYINNIHDMIVAVPYNMFVWSMVNLGKVRTYGVDATSEMVFTPKSGHDITLTCNFSFQRAMPMTNPESSEWKKQVAYIPRHSGSMSISYENPWINLSLSGTGVSDRYTTNNNLPSTKIDGYLEFGATAWRTFNIKKNTLNLRLDIQNILDKQYYVVARYPMPGRQYKITLSWEM